MLVLPYFADGCHESEAGNAKYESKVHWQENRHWPQTDRVGRYVKWLR